jgi:arylsulfatase A-like enzyme
MAVRTAPGRPFITEAVLLPEGVSLETGFAFTYPPQSIGTDSVSRELKTRISVHLLHGNNEEILLHTGVHDSTREKSWNDLVIDLGPHAGRTVRFRLDWQPVSPDVDWSPKRIQPAWSTPRLLNRATRGRDEPRLVILASLDSLRADTLGCQGYPRLVSPALDRFRRDAVQYAACTTPSPWTRPAHMSMLTSLYPHVHGLDQAGRTTLLSRSHRTWAELFGEAGFLTMAITGGGYVHSNQGFERGFHRFHSQREDFAVQWRRAIDWLAARPEQDIFLFLHTFATHSPYNQHGDLILHSTGDPNRSRSNPPREQIPGMAKEATRLRRLYDDGVLYTDHCMAGFIGELKRLGLYRRAMIFITSDHGDLFMEHGLFGHSTRLYDELLRVPLLVKYPDGSSSPARGTVVERQVRLIDLLPTACEVFGIAGEPSGQFQGRSLLDSDPDRWLYAETWEGGARRRSVRTDELSYIVNVTDGAEELFRLSSDPGQQLNLIEIDDVAAGQCRQLYDLADRMAQQRPGPGEALETTMDQHQRQALEALGYVVDE